MDRNRQYHAEQLVKIADLMESYSDDPSHEGRQVMKELRADYRAHAEAMGIDMTKTVAQKLAERGKK